MKVTVRIAMLIGAAVMVALIVREGAANITLLLSQAGFVLLWLVPLHVLPLLLDVLGWRVLVPGRPRLSALLWIASVREAINRLLPVANIGGEIVGIRLLALTGVGTTAAAASVVVEVLLTLVSQYLFVALGLVGLLSVTGSVGLSNGMLLGLLAGLPVIAVVVLAVRHGSLFERLHRFAERLLDAEQRRAIVAKGADLDAAIHQLCSHYLALVRATAWQLAGLIVGCLETWAALRWLGSPVSFAEALVLESLTQAARNFIFMVPAGLGVQEAGLLGIGHVLGLPSDVALALSLAKRMREILFGVPALVAWQWLEGRRGLLHARSRSGY